MDNTQDTAFQDLAFVEYIVKQIVDYPEEVSLERTVDEMGVLITLKVSKSDMGKVIGKNGQTAKSIRILLRGIGSKNNARVNLKIVEPPDGANEGSQNQDSGANIDESLGI